MLIWIRENKRKVAGWFVWPLIIVFIALYGSSSIQRRRALDERTAVKVNGERISIARYRSVSDEVNRFYSQSPVQPDKPAALIALEQAVQQEIARQLAEELGLRTDDSKINQRIAQQMGGGQGIVNEAVYKYFLEQSGFSSHEAYKEFLRAQMDVQLALNYIRGTAVPSETEIRRGLTREKEKRSIELLTFASRDYFDQVDATTQEVEAYFKEHIERYRFRKRMKIRYVETKPEDFIDEATPEGERMERWFRSVREDFLVPAERDVSVVVFSAPPFRDDVEVKEEDLTQYYENHRSQYREPEKFKARFVKISVEVPDASIEAEMQKNPDEFKTQEEAVAARHLLLRVAADAGPEKTAEIEKKIREIRDRIKTEEDFIREAKEFSEDLSNKPKGGDLGYFSKGRMVPEFEKAAFSIAEGTVSEPVKTRYGYHLIWVYAHRPAGEMMSVDEARFRVLRNIDVTPLRDKAREELTRIKESLAGKSLAEASTVTELPVYVTDWFTRGDAPHPEASRDRYAFYQAVANLKPGEMTDIVEGFSGFYLIEVLEKQESRQQSYDEVRDKVETAYRTEKAAGLAREKAQEAANLIRAGSLTFEAVPETYGLPKAVTYTGLHTPGSEQLSRNRTVDREIINRAFTAEVGKVEGPFDTLQGSALLKVLADRPEHLPDLDEVRDQVESAYRKVLAEKKARDAIWDVWTVLDDFEGDLAKAAESIGLSATTSEFFRPGEPIPGFPSNSVVNYVAAGLRVVGATTSVVEDPPKDPNNPQPIRAYYLIEAATIEESRLPRFEEVADQVRDDLLLEKAAALAKRDAEQALSELEELIREATGPLSASRTVDLKAFAREKGYKFRGPVEFPYGIHSPLLPGKNSAAALSETVYRLPLGALTRVVPAAEATPEGKRVAQRIHGYCIAQVVDIEKPKTGGASRGEVFRALVSRLQEAAQSDWSERVRLQVDIEPNRKYFSEEVLQEFEKERRKKT